MGANDMYEEQIEAVGRFTGATGATLFARGCTISRTSAGLYVITLPRGLNANDAVLVATSEGAATNLVFSWQHTSDTVKTLNAVTGSTGAVGDPTTVQFRISRNAYGTNA